MEDAYITKLCIYTHVQLSGCDLPVASQLQEVDGAFLLPASVLLLLLSVCHQHHGWPNGSQVPALSLPELSSAALSTAAAGAQEGRHTLVPGLQSQRNRHNVK